MRNSGKDTLDRFHEVQMITLRDYQDKAASMLTRHRRGIVVIPAGGGKTIVASSAIERVLRARKELNIPRAKIRWIAGTTDQCDQAREALNLFTLFEQADIEIGCPGKIWRIRNPDLAVVDECHHCPCDSWKASLDDCNKARWGFTATPFRNDEKTFEIFNLIGNMIFQIDQDTLRDAGAIVPGIVKFIEVRGMVYDLIEKLALAEFEIQHRRFPHIPQKELLNRCRYRFAKEIGIEKFDHRNNLVSGIAREQSASTLLLVGSIEHGEKILELAGVDDGVMLHSKTKGRKKIVKAFREQEIPLLIATSLADEGFDVPCASVLILAAGGRAANRVEQRAGRVLRPAPGKTHGTIFDFLDHQHPFLLAQSRARKRVYESLGYKIL